MLFTFIRRACRSQVSFRMTTPVRRPSRIATCLPALSLGALLLVASALGQSPARKQPAGVAISNRQPTLEEIGYLPADGSTPSLNPPSFAWLQEKSASHYQLQWSSRPDFKSPTSISNLWLNCYTHNEALPPGEYWWHYQLLTTNGAASTWSQARKFTVSKDAAHFPMPSIAQRRELLPNAHPRLFMRPEDLPKLRQLAKGSQSAQFKLLYDQAQKLSLSEPPAEPTTRGSATDKKNLQALKDWWPNRERAVLACDQASTLAFVYLLTGERRFGEAARKRVMALAAWDPDGPTNFKLNCEAGKPLLHLISRAYDWAYDMFSPADRAIVQKAIARRIQDAWISGEVAGGTGHINRPFNSHGNRTWHKIGESGIVFLGEIPEAETWLDYALNKYYTCYPVWADEDGGWHEGLAYFAGYMGKVVWWFQGAQSGFGIDPFKKPVLSSLSDFPLYLAPPHTPNMGFGDLSYRGEISSSWGTFMDYFTRAGAAHGAAHAPYWQWWSDQWRLKPATGVLGFLHAVNLPPAPPAKPPTDLPQSKIFAGIGVASLHTTLLDSLNDVHFLFKSSPRGSVSHGHNPQNTFQLNAYGDALLTACVYRDYYGTDFHYKWVHQTVAQNGVLVNGEGQIPHQAKSRGRIFDSKLTPEYDYLAGDALEAYDGKLTRALRKVLFIKPGIIVIFDDLAAPQPAEFQFMLHALVPFKMEDGGRRATVQQPRAGVLIDYLAPGSVKFRQWDGFKPAPVKGNFPNHWHLETATMEKKAGVEMLTVIAPFRGSTQPRLACTRSESPSAIGARIELDDSAWLVGFKRTGAPETAELAGNRFTEPFLVRKTSKP